jgi:hypothetical protein
MSYVSDVSEEPAASIRVEVRSVVKQFAFIGIENGSGHWDWPVRALLISTLLMEAVRSSGMSETLPNFNTVPEV